MNFLGGNVFRLGLLKVEGERVGTSQLGCKDADPDPGFTVKIVLLSFNLVELLCNSEGFLGDSFVILSVRVKEKN